MVLDKCIFMEKNAVFNQTLKKMKINYIIDRFESWFMTSRPDAYQEYVQYTNKKKLSYVNKIRKIVQLTLKYLKKRNEENRSKLIFPESSLNQYPDKQDIFSKVKNYDIISFDIFDTLIFRKVEKPIDIFRIIEEETGILNFAVKRQEAERKARKKSGKLQYMIYIIYCMKN